MDFKILLDGIFNEGTEEYNQIKECYELISKSAPTISAEMKTTMILLDHSRVNLSTIYFMLCRNISKMKAEFQQTYDSQYARLVKLGRPSNAAIEAEIRSQNPEYSGITMKIETFEYVKDLINSYIKCIDECKKTTIEALRDSRRID